jgi:hypothetical protein
VRPPLANLMRIRSDQSSGFVLCQHWHRLLFLGKLRQLQRFDNVTFDVKPTKKGVETAAI